MTYSRYGVGVFVPRFPSLKKGGRGILSQGYILILLLGLCALGCENWYEDGPLERGIRTAFNGWDMWSTAAVRPYEGPMPGTVEGTVPRDGLSRIEKGRAEIEKWPKETRQKRSALSYRRYCHHCHGPNGDGRIIVGESLNIKPTDLRSPAVQHKTDAAFFAHIQDGGKLMLPLAETLSPLEIMLTIDYIRTLGNRPSTPHFKRQYTEPIR